MSHKPGIIENTKPVRLPCRGCQTSCSNYATCGGKPWRLDTQVVRSPLASDASHQAL